MAIARKKPASEGLFWRFLRPYTIYGELRSFTSRSLAAGIEPLLGHAPPGNTTLWGSDGFRA
jgi:hypothetical protein